MLPPLIRKARTMLSIAKNPLFFFDDDPDGLCAYMILSHFTRCGHGSMVKAKPYIDRSYLAKVEEYHPDLIVILDVPIVEQEFIDAVKVPIVWVDHHQPLERPGALYVNPRQFDLHANFPTTRLAYMISPKEEDLWIAMAGSVADYHLPDFTPEFIARYPDLLASGQTIEQARYDTEIGKVPRILTFLLKGRTSEVKKSIAILIRLQSPYELLRQETPAAKYLMKRYQTINRPYQRLLTRAKKVTPMGRILLFTYQEDEFSLTSELSNELSHLYPNHTIIVAREKSGEMKCSVRGKNPPVLSALTPALVGIDGYGGGHEVACGLVVKVQDWDRFLDRFEEELDKRRQ